MWGDLGVPGRAGRWLLPFSCAGSESGSEGGGGEVAGSVKLEAGSEVREVVAVDLVGGGGGRSGDVAGVGGRRRGARSTSSPRAGSGSSSRGKKRRGGIWRRSQSSSPKPPRKKLRGSARTMDGRWDFTAGLPDLSGPSGTPYQDMLNMPGFEEPVQPAPTHAFEPGSRQGGSGKPRKKTVSRPKQNNFSIEEDKNLVSSWLNVSLDPVKGAGQRKSSFWKAIEQNYNAQKGPMYPIRTLRSLEGRWSDIKEQANKFESHYNNILNERRSGYSDMDKIAAAIELYNSLEDRPFTTIHCWEMLRNEPKWMDLNNHGKQDRGRVPEDVNAPIDVTESGCGEAGSESQIGTSKRPPGRDISRSGKRTCSSGSPSDAGSEFSSMLSAMHIQKMDLIRTFDDCVASKMDRLVTIQEKNIELKKKKDAREQELRDERIMAIDLTTCNPGQRVLYEAMQREILQRWAARNEDAP